MEGQENTNMSDQNGSSAGPIIGTIVILAVIVFGAIYFWGEKGEEVMPEAEENAAMEAELNTEAEVEVPTFDDSEVNAS